MPFASICPTDPRTNPAQFREKLLKIDGFEKHVFLSRTVWNFFLLNLIKTVKGSWVARMGRNLDVYPGF